MLKCTHELLEETRSRTSRRAFKGTPRYPSERLASTEDTTITENNEATAWFPWLPVVCSHFSEILNPSGDTHCMAKGDGSRVSQASQTSPTC